MRLDYYWKRAAAGVAAMMLLLAGPTGVESFAMPGGSLQNTVNAPDHLIISGSQTPAEGSGGQVVSPKAETLPFGSVNTPVTDPNTMFGPGRLTMYANHATNAQLLSVIIETGEGGLIVVDGGWRENAPYLLEQIKQKGGHVQAWLLTHPDSDHAGALYEILNSHLGEITLDGVYYDFQDPAWYQEKDAEMYGMVWLLNQAFAKTPQEILHGDLTAGQVIEAGPAKIQVLNQSYRLDADPVNNSSVAYLVSLNGTNVVFLGDLAYEGGERLRQEVDLRSLGCDVVQMAHHGQNGVGYYVYKELKPTACLWPTPQWLWDNDSGSGENSGSWKTMETRGWMSRLEVGMNYCIKDGDQVIE